MPSCAALNCTARRTKDCGKTFHKFPHSRPTLLQQWLASMRRDKFRPSAFALLCSDHFDDSCFDKTGQTVRLKADAVPTKFKFPMDGIQANFQALGTDTLKRYLDQHCLSTEQEQGRAQLIEAVTQHFKTIVVSEKEVVALFIYSVKLLKESGSPHGAESDLYEDDLFSDCSLLS